MITLCSCLYSNYFYNFLFTVIQMNSSVSYFCIMPLVIVVSVLLVQVKFSELTLDTFRMLQCLEWEPSGSFYQPSVMKNSQNGSSASSRSNYSQDIIDPTLPPNPRKAVLYRPSITHFLAVSMIEKLVFRIVLLY